MGAVSTVKLGLGAWGWGCMFGDMGRWMRDVGCRDVISEMWGGDITDVKKENMPMQLKVKLKKILSSNN